MPRSGPSLALLLPPGAEEVQEDKVSQSSKKDVAKRWREMGMLFIAMRSRGERRWGEV